MRILLVHPQDSARVGPWFSERWDVVVDLGRSSSFSREAWGKHYGCTVLSADTYREGIADGKRVREMFSAGRGYLIDEKRIDQWELAATNLFGEALSILALQRLSAELPDSADLWSTRPDWRANVVSRLSGRPVHHFHRGFKPAGSTVAHYASLFRRFSISQIREIAWDKYDPGFWWRGRLSGQRRPLAKPVVLIPSAYENVSRVAAGYAALLPEQSFLLVATRESAKRCSTPANIHIRDLAQYATEESREGESAMLRNALAKLRANLQSDPFFRVLFGTGVSEQVSEWLGYGLAVRDAWSKMLDTEPVEGVLCGDDSNLYTRLPVLLASARKIPTVDFHHGALDGNYLLKDLPSDVFLAKTEMERDYLLRICGLPADRIVIAPPVEPPPTKARSSHRLAVLFSEPYEVGGMRADEVYRELLPALWQLARENGRELVVKLHPFESRSERSRIIRNILSADAARQIRIVEGPRTPELVGEAWFGITIESTTAMECARNGVCCFLCRWLALSSYGYQEQYARFRIGQALETAEQIAQIPQLLADFSKCSGLKWADAVEPALLRQLLTAVHEPSGVRSAS